ncbi:hypothetical protein [Streptomyces albus]|uniref:hypothetical protein n=1 Tax=Streptomyces albus TaxID=1888 RepID=UPI001FC98105|nr:hypothetical protein [Streptomyces albus]
MSELRDENRAEELRNKTVDQLVADGTITSARVEAALRKVPRHIAVPEVPVEKAYSVYEPVVTKQDEHGVYTSSVSAPQIQAMQLEQADIQPGDRVLEIGTNGPNAAYIAELAGPTGQVTTVDIDPAPADRAQRFLDATGYTGVRVLVGDAEYGVPDRAPFDAILVTAGAWDIPPAWIAQLNEGGRLVVFVEQSGSAWKGGSGAAARAIRSTRRSRCWRLGQVGDLRGPSAPRAVHAAAKSVARSDRRLGRSGCLRSASSCSAAPCCWGEQGGSRSPGTSGRLRGSVRNAR